MGKSQIKNQKNLACPYDSGTNIKQISPISSKHTHMITHLAHTHNHIYVALLAPYQVSTHI